MPLDWNVKYVFGLGGSEEVGFLDALVDRVRLQYVQALHESSVVAMADGYARTSGHVGRVFRPGAAPNAPHLKMRPTLIQRY
jgi:thiamine pyrophosphate-dependent acetolactate synthase large subunit-like protein